MRSWPLSRQTGAKSWLKASNLVGVVLGAARSEDTVLVGAGPRATQAFVLASRANAALQQRDFVTPDDVKALALPVLRHRLSLSPAAEIEGRDIEALVAELIESTEAPR